MPPSAYTIGVSQSRSDGTRDVTLKHHGTQCYATTHRDVLWAFLAHFAPAGAVKNNGGSGKMPQPAEVMRQFSILSEVNVNGHPSSLAGLSSHHSNCVSDEVERLMKRPCLTTGMDVATEYLCVFHREELKDRFGRYTVSQPSTLCTAYSVKDGTSSQFVLHNVSPTSVVPGTSGVFVQGRRQTSRWGYSTPVAIDGATYYPAADMWWMASPLTIKPVYVQVSPPLPSPTQPGAETMIPTGEPFSSWLPDSRRFIGSQNNGGGGGGTRSTSPLPPASVTSNNVVLDAVVIGQFRACRATNVAVARTGDTQLGLALTAPHYHLDILTWTWLPQRVQLPRLSSSNSALSVTVSEHSSLSTQVLFLSDANTSIVYLIRTPDLDTGMGDMELLAALPNAGHPLVLPCLRPSTSTPQPVLVCNWPHDNEVTLYNPLRLLHASVTTEGGEYGSTRSAADCYIAKASLDGSDGTLAPCLLRPSQQQQQQQQRQEQYENISRNETPHPQQINLFKEDNILHVGPATSPHMNAVTDTYASPRIDDIAYQDGAYVVFCYSQSASSPPPSARGPPGAAASPRRRRYECMYELPVGFPCLDGATEDPLVCVMLETLEAAIGPERVAELEYALVADAWRAAKKAQPWNCSASCQSLIVDIVRASIAAEDEMKPASSSSPSASCARLRLHVSQRLFALLSDPYSLSAVAVDSLCTPDFAPMTDTITTTIETTSAMKPEDVTLPLVIVWPSDVCALSLISLHLLCESCKLQEKLWPFLEPLSEINAKLSALLGWARYINVYAVSTSPLAQPSRHRECPGAARDTPLKFTQSGETEVVSRFDFNNEEHTHEKGDSHDETSAPVLLKVIDYRAGLSAASVRTALHALISGVPPLLHTSLRHILLKVAAGSANAVEGCWPMLKGLSAHHPIVMANRIYCLYRECFGLGNEGKGWDAIGGGVGLHQSQEQPWWEAVCTGLLRHNISSSFVCKELSIGVAYPLINAIMKGRDAPKSSWSEELYAVVGRLDHIKSVELLAKLSNPGSDVLRLSETRAIGRRYRATLSDDDGVNMRPDFNKTWTDSRVDRVQALLNTAAPILLPGQGDGADSLQQSLQSLAKRACALPIGRGMLTMCTQNFKIRDSVPIPPLCLDGHTTEGISVSNNSDAFSPMSVLWPLFHNGCAAGLRFLTLASQLRGASLPRAEGGGGDTDSSGASAAASAAGIAAGGDASHTPTITRHWVVYQTRNVPCPASRAGLLLATGILGHLCVLQLTDIYSLLASSQAQFAWREVTAMAVMLGLSCSFRGTNDDLVFRCLSMHVQSLTPSAEDIEVSMDVQTSALVSIGLLCQQLPTNTFLVEMLLVEISRLPSDEHCLYREGYALGAGFGLGLMLLGLGASHGIHNVERRLFSFLEGAQREPAPSTCEGLDTYNELGRDAGHFLTRSLLMQSAQETNRSACILVYEGDKYNAAISGPAAVVALGMMYLKTSNERVAKRLAPPRQNAALQGVSPTLCLLRTAMSALVCWPSIEATQTWVHSQVPTCLQELANSGRACMLGLAQQQVHYLMMDYGHCVAGAVYALGMRFAGSMDADARAVILSELKGFMKGHIGTTGVTVPALQRSTSAYEACICACVSAISLVMAGTGDLKVFAILQRLHKRTGNVSYGLQMAVSMSVGMLFLGGGRLTLSNSTPSIAALLIALYPVWPRSPQDNVQHLQALRHLYGLAVVPRVIETVDAVSNRPVSIPIRIILRRGRVCPQQGGGVDGFGAKNAAWTPVPRGMEGQEVRLRTPCLYPPADTIERIEVRGANYYPLTIYNNAIGSALGASLATSGPGMFTDNGLTIRVLKNQDLQRKELEGEVDGAADRPLGGGGEAPLQSVSGGGTASLRCSASECRVMDWLRRLFSHPGTSVLEALTVLDNIKLLQVSQRVLLLSDAPAHSEMQLSVDFGCAVAQTLERRYKYIFSRPKEQDAESAGTSQVGAGGARSSLHPLHELIVRQAPFAEVVRSIAAYPKGSPAFPCDFTALAGNNNSSDNGSDATGGVTLDLPGLSRWIAEAIHYFDLGGDTTRIQTELLAHAAQLRRDAAPRKRTAALLRLNLHLLMPISTLEKLVDCCISS